MVPSRVDQDLVPHEYIHEFIVSECTKTTPEIRTPPSPNVPSMSVVEKYGKKFAYKH